MDHCVVVGKSWLLASSSNSIERKRKREKNKNSGTHALIIRQLFENEEKKIFTCSRGRVLFGLGNSIRSSFFCLAMGAQSSMTLFLHSPKHNWKVIIYYRQITMMQLSSKLLFFLKRKNMVWTGVYPAAGPIKKWRRSRGFLKPERLPAWNFGIRSSPLVVRFYCLWAAELLEKKGVLYSGRRTNTSRIKIIVYN